MRTVCIYTAQDRRSVAIADDCIKSGARYGIEVEPHKAVWFDDMYAVHEQYGLDLKYTPITGNVADYVARKMPRTRIANGTTHYLLYKWAVEHDAAIHILEHDALFVGQPPGSIYDGVIQTSSHTMFQQIPGLLWDSTRAQKQRKYEPDRTYDWEWDVKFGVITHPLSGTFGTSGYIIGPGAAAKMVEYVESDGIANADRIRTEHIGEGNVYLQSPQSVFCTHAVRSDHL